MLHWIDAAIIILYLAIVVGVGVLSRGKQATAEDYFTASGSLHGWVGSVLVGLSIAATLFSGISFLAYPSVVYGGGVEILVALLVFPLAWVILAGYFLPRYLSRAGQHPYTIIERRLGSGARTAAATMFVMLRMGWMAALIYAPTVAIIAAAGLSPTWFWPLVLTIGVSSTIYTTLGGIRGVIVTDAIQFLVIAGGILFTIIYVLTRLPVSFDVAAEALVHSGHFDHLNFSINPTEPLTVWAVLIGATVANLGSYLADQMSLQRYLAAGDARSASRSFAINVVGVTIVLVMLSGVGLAIASWYQHVPDAALPTDADQVFPYFVATQLPIGLAGLLLAAIVAATMSSITSGINALAGTLTLDFRARIGRPLQPRDQLFFARSMSLLIGVASTLVAGVVGALGSIFDIAQSLLGVFLGPLLACILLAVSPWTIRSRSVTVSLVLGSVIGWLVIFSPVTSLWVAPAAFVSTVLLMVVVHLIDMLTPGIPSSAPVHDHGTRSRATTARPIASHDES